MLLSIIHHAAAKGPTSLLESLLAGKADVNTRNNESQTPLHLAAAHNQVMAMQLLLDNGAALESPDRDGQTPLCYAVKNGCTNIVKQLTLSNADINSRDLKKFLPIHYAMINGHVDIVAFLLEKNAIYTPLHRVYTLDERDKWQGFKALNLPRLNPNIQSTITGKTMLHYAVMYKRFDVLRTLLDLHGSMNVIDAAGETPFSTIFLDDSYDINPFKSLLKGIKIQLDMTPKLRSLFHSICERGVSQDVAFFVKNVVDINVNAKDEAGETPTHRVCKVGDHASLKLLIDHKADMNIQDNSGQTSLFHAIKHENMNILRILLDKGANPNVIDIRGDTPFVLAVKSASITAISLLLANGATIDTTFLLSAEDFQQLCTDKAKYRGITLLDLAATYMDVNTLKIIYTNSPSSYLDKQDNSTGFTPLCMAIQRGCTDIVDFLIENKANIHHKTSDNRTPLHLAVSRNAINCVDLLVKHGADTCHQTDDGDTPLHVALKRCHYDIALRLIQSKSGVNAQDKCDRTPLHLAYYHGYLGIVKNLLERHADVNLVDDKQQTVLHMAASHRISLPFTQKLIDCGAKTDLRDMNKNTPLHHAIEHGVEEIALHLLSIDSSMMNSPNIHGNTPLILALQRCFVKVAQTLIEMGCKLDTRITKDRQTLLHIACDHGALPIVSLLISKGFDVNECDNLNQSPLILACKHGHTGIVQLLLHHNADVHIHTNGTNSTALHLASRHHHLDTIKLLVESNASVDLIDKKSRNALYLAFKSNHNGDVLRYLIEDAGSSLTHLGLSDTTALHLAAQAGMVSVVQLLLDKKIDPDMVNDSRETPLQIACQEGHTNVVELLLQNGANVHAKDMLDETALHFAADKGSIDIMQLLIDHKANVDICNRNGNVPLYIACEKRHTDAVELLITHYSSTTKSYAVSIATAANCPDMVRLLLENGASIDDDSDRGADQRPLRIALKHGYVDVAYELLKHTTSPIPLSSLLGIPENAVSKKTGQSLLHIIILTGHEELINLIVPLVKSVNIKDRKGWTPLHLAVHHQSLSSIKLLIENNASIDQPNDDGWTPLHEACYAGASTFAAELIQYNANVNARSHRGHTPLHSAAVNGHVSIMELLLGSNSKIETGSGSPQRQTTCDINAINDNGRTPLHLAVLHGHTQFVHQLLIHNAMGGIRDRFGKTPMDLAFNQSDITMAYMLLPHAPALGPHANSTIRCPVNQVCDTTNGNVLLHVACEHNLFNMIQLLIRNDAVIDIKNNHGQTPLFLAVQHCHLQSAKLLLKHGASVHLTDDFGRTALFYSTTISMAQLLIEHGADYFHLDHNNTSATDFIENEAVRNSLITIIHHDKTAMALSAEIDQLRKQNAEMLYDMSEMKQIINMLSTTCQNLMDQNQSLSVSIRMLQGQGEATPMYDSLNS